MKSIQTDTRSFFVSGAAWDDGTLGQSWQCSVLWGSVMLEALSECANGYRLPDLALPTACNSTAFGVVREKGKRQAASLAWRRVN